MVSSGDFKFFNNMVNYSISGIFTKYVIDRVGLHAYENAYASNRVVELIKETGGTLQQFIEDFRVSLEKT